MATTWWGLVIGQRAPLNLLCWAEIYKEAAKDAAKEAARTR